jgi:putative chitinase
MQLTPAIIAAGCGTPLDRAQAWLAPMQAACDFCEISTPLRVAAFLATVGVESARLTALVENMNYGAEGLIAEFPHEFPDLATANQYARQPEKIANRAYANRMGNGDEASGDGWKFIGRGCIQVTGRSGYMTTGVALDLDLESEPELLEQPANAAMSAGWYWFEAKLNALADAGDFLSLSRVVNLGDQYSSGTPGSYSQRLALYGAAKKSLGLT